MSLEYAFFCVILLDYCLAAPAANNCLQSLAMSGTKIVNRLLVVGDLTPSGRGAGSFGQSEIDFGAGQDDEIDTAVLGASFGCVVAGHGVELSVSGGGKAVGGEGVHVEKEAGNAGGACGG
jgi:hypothetical protein